LKVKCANCGKEVNRAPFELKKSKSGRAFCSSSCSSTYNNRFRVGEANPNWNGGTSNYRQRAIECYGAFCAVCGYDVEEVLIVHHLDNDRQNNDITNLVVLCPTHHVEYHIGICQGKVLLGSTPALGVGSRGSNPRSLTYNRG
jgi:hypothetical protein